MENLRNLRKENKEQREHLKENYSQEYEKMWKYLRLSSINGYDKAIAEKELQGMLLEAQERGNPVESVIGEKPKEFLKDLIGSSKKKSIAEYAAVICTYVFVEILAYYLIVWTLLESAPQIVSITAFDLTAAVGLGILNLVNSMIETKKAYESKINQTGSVIVGIVIFFTLILCIRNLRTIMLFQVSWWIPIVVLGALSAIAYFGIDFAATHGRKK